MAGCIQLLVGQLTLISLALCASPRARSMYSLLVMTDFGRRMYWNSQSTGAANMPQPANTRNSIQPAGRAHRGVGLLHVAQPQTSVGGGLCAAACVRRPGLRQEAHCLGTRTKPCWHSFTLTHDRLDRHHVDNKGDPCSPQLASEHRSECIALQCIMDTTTDRVTVSCLLAWAPEPLCKT